LSAILAAALSETHSSPRVLEVDDQAEVSNVTAQSASGPASLDRSRASARKAAPIRADSRRRRSNEPAPDEPEPSDKRATPTQDAGAALTTAKQKSLGQADSTERRAANSPRATRVAAPPPKHREQRRAAAPDRPVYDPVWGF
jgi:hypothetical protein